MSESLDQAQMAAFVEALALAQSISHGNRAGQEPAYRYLTDPPGKSVIQAYLQQRSTELPVQSDTCPVLYVELPPLPPKRLPLVEVLSRTLDLPMAGKWKDRFLAEERLAAQLRARQVELVILADAHHLINRPFGVEWLVSFFRQHLSDVPLVLVGEREQMDNLLLWKATAWVVRRWSRIQLPGEPEERVERNAALRRLFERANGESS